MSDPKYAYPYPAQGYYQGPPVMAPPQYQYAAPQPARQTGYSHVYKASGSLASFPSPGEKAVANAENRSSGSIMLSKCLSSFISFDSFALAQALLINNIKEESSSLDFARLLILSQATSIEGELRISSNLA
ncbi:hypothetical protein Lal_00026348 [Lupinus albus]|nr:hypothetical protein Lal_00026348 [Lupinus albus]